MTVRHRPRTRPTQTSARTAVTSTSDQASGVSSKKSRNGAMRKNRPNANSIATARIVGRTSGCSCRCRPVPGRRAGGGAAAGARPQNTANVVNRVRARSTSDAGSAHQYRGRPRTTSATAGGTTIAASGERIGGRALRSRPDRQEQGGDTHRQQRHDRVELGIDGHRQPQQRRAEDGQRHVQHARQEHGEAVMHARDDPLALQDRLRQCREGVLEQHDVGDRAGRLAATLHRDAQLRLLQRQDVVDAVADHGDPFAALAQGAHETGLERRRHPPEHGPGAHGLGQLRRRPSAPARGPRWPPRRGSGRPGGPARPRSPGCRPR